MKKRGNVYWVQRKFGTLGVIARSLETKTRAIARQREQLLIFLLDKGWTDLLLAFKRDRLGIDQLVEAHDTETLADLARGLKEKPAVKLADAISNCRTWKTPDVKHSTLKRYGEGWHQFEEFAGEDATVEQALTTKTVQGFKARCLEKKLKPETINNHLIAISVLATYCIDEGLIDSRPKIKKYRPKTRIRYLEPDQVRVYMANVRKPFRVLFQVLIGSGMRYGEAAGLHVCDIKVGSDGARAMVEDSKTEAGVRAVFLPGWVAEAVAAEIEERGLTGADSIFTIPYHTVYKEHRRACKFAGITRYSLHDHRHSAAVHLARSGMPLDLLRDQLGHTSVKQTEKYCRFHPSYNDVARYFAAVSVSLGLGAGSQGQSRDSAPETADKQIAGTV